jgi:hypothetical protein
MIYNIGIEFEMLKIHVSFVSDLPVTKAFFSS